MHMRRLGAELGEGAETNFADKNFSMTFLGKKLHFTPKISDDLFFSHRPYFFQILLPVYTV